MIERTFRDLPRLLGAGALFLVVGLMPGLAEAQVDIYPGTDIQSVLNQYPGGTAFRLKTGTHRMQQIRPRSGDSFVGESGTVLNGSRVLTSFGRAGSLWYASGQTQQGVAYGMCDPGYSRCIHPEQLYINNETLEHVASIGEVRSGKWFFDYNNDVIYFADDPSGKLVEASVTGGAFEATGDNITITNLTIEKYANASQHGAIHCEGRTNWVISSNNIRLNHGPGARVGPRAQVRGNNFHHNGQIGLVGLGGNILVENNEIAYNNLANYVGSWEGAGTKFVATQNLVIRGNFVHHNRGAGLWADIDNVNTLYENNTVEDNLRFGILHEISYNAVIRNNTIKRNGWAYSDWMEGAGISIGASADVEIYGNLVEGNADGIAGAQQNRGSGTYGVHLLANIYVHHNTLINNAGWTGIVQDIGDLSIFTSRNIRFEANRYQLGTQQYTFTWMNRELTKDQWLAYGLDNGAEFGIGTTPSAPTAPTAPTSGATYLSDMQWTSASNGWGAVERDRSNGESGASDGKTLSLGGRTYAKGLGVHPSGSGTGQVKFNLNGACSVFTATVGVDDEVGNNGSVLFQVWADGMIRYSTGVAYGYQGGFPISVNVAGVRELGLVVTTGGDGADYDHGDWADAKVACN